MKLSDSCEKHFGTKDLYKVLNISGDPSEIDVNRAYYRLSLPCHPKNVSGDDRCEAIEKFIVLGKIHAYLSNPEKRVLLNESGVLTDDDDGNKYDEKYWMDYWGKLFSVNNECTVVDDFDTHPSNVTMYFQSFRDYYRGSAEELADLQRAYLMCRGDIDKMFSNLLFLSHDDEDRIRCILRKLVEGQVLPAFPIFVEETQTVRDRRMRQLRKEADEDEDD